MNIANFLNGSENVQLVVNATDLKEFALTILEERQQVRPKEQKEDKLLSAKEAMKRLQCKEVTLWRWAKSGFLLPKKVGCRNFYRESDIERVLNAEKI